MEPPVPPPPPPPDADAPLTIRQLGSVALINYVVYVSWGLVIDRRQFLILLWLPLLNLLAGFLLLFTRYTRLGKMMLLGFLVAFLIGLGTCALLTAR